METPLDWDLLALVRSCSSTTTTTTSTTATTTTQPPLPPPQQPPQQPCFHTTKGLFFHFSSSNNNNNNHELKDVCKSLSYTTTTTSTSTCATVSSAVSTTAPFMHDANSFRGLVKPSHVIFGTSSTIGSGGGQRIKKRKNLMKKVCHVPAEGLSSDMWAWRKYGQKPIKGSPYPRGYYRCSSSKGCLARKQVERNKTDPKMLIVTYTSEHNHPMPTHRNSLAGSTRQKPLSDTEPPSEQPSCSSPSTTTLSPLTEKSESKVEWDDTSDDMAVSELMVNDDFCVGFEEFDGGFDGSGGFTDQFSSLIEFPWLASYSSAATAGGS